MTFVIVVATLVAYKFSEYTYNRYKVWSLLKRTEQVTMQIQHSQVIQDTQILNARLGTLEAAYEKGLNSIDEQARIAVNAVNQRLGALEQALKIQDDSIKQIVAVIAPPVQRAAQAQTRALTMDEQISLAREAANMANGVQHAGSVS